MKHLFLVLSLFSTLNVFSQNKKLLTQVPKTVPPGKKWVLEANKSMRVEIGSGMQTSGSFCNAMFFSNPGIVFNVNRGNLMAAESYGIIFNDAQAIPGTNKTVYAITPMSFIDKGFSTSQLAQVGAENVGSKKLVFLAGESVFIGNCLESLEVNEVAMTAQEIQSQQAQTGKAKKEESALLANFVIPVNTDHAVAPGTKPAIRDKGFQQIIFKSNAVLWKKPGKGMSADKSAWTITLNTKTFEIRSLNYTRTFQVTGAAYDEMSQSQKFELTDRENGQPFHVLISYSESQEEYSVILQTKDYKEEYQFQGVQLKEKSM
ncbi:hypothetical protein [Chitinophaga dinghuensis]|nr:hypothetical protein [Chitinophaga dinghuensis]